MDLAGSNRSPSKDPIDRPGLAESYSAGREEAFIPFLQEPDVWPRAPLRWQREHRPVDTLERVPQCRSVVLLKDIGSDFHDEVWADPDDVAIERSMVDRAQGYPIRNHGLPTVRVFLDIRRRQARALETVVDGRAS
jgi:hypothetical protein